MRSGSAEPSDVPLTLSLSDAPPPFRPVVEQAANASDVHAMRARKDFIAETDAATQPPQSSQNAGIPLKGSGLACHPRSYFAMDERLITIH